jgi:hypothetical protein
MDDLQSWQGHNKLRAALVRSGFATANEVLACPSHSLQIRAKLSATEVDQCKALLSAWRLPDTSSVGSLAQLPAQLLSVGTEAIDRLLAGGLRPGTVTEIYGEAWVSAITTTPRLDTRTSARPARATFACNSAFKSSCPSSKAVCTDQSSTCLLKAPSRLFASAKWLWRVL